MKFILKILRSSIELLKTCLRIVLFSSLKRESSLLSYSNTCIHEKCVIIGNGPSIKSITLSRAKTQNVDFYVMNDFVLIADYPNLSPDYYILADPLYFNDHNDENPLSDLIFRSLIEKTKWEMRLCIPVRYKNNNYIKDLTEKNKFIKIVFFNYTTSNLTGKIKRILLDRQLIKPNGTNVLITAIFSSIIFGHKEIHLYGTEHDWINHISVNNNNQVCLKNPNSIINPNNEVKNWYKEDGKSIFTMPEILRILANIFDGYHELKAYADYRRVNIYNRTPNSMIDAFEKINYEPTNELHQKPN